MTEIRMVRIPRRKKIETTGGEDPVKIHETTIPTGEDVIRDGDIIQLDNGATNVAIIHR